ncbi:MAG: hypothetical protein JJ975_09320 [Bacteroidia bacterium]|nr:hypothetical protein [Bacteroidia bacterium]
MKNIKILTCLSMAIWLLGASCKETQVETPSPQTVTYKSHIEALMKNYCYTCHSGSSPAAKLDLTTYEAVSSVAQAGTLEKRMNDDNEPMPPSGVVSKQKRDLITSWIAGGLNEN